MSLDFLNDLPIGSMAAAIVGALAILAWRMHEATRAVSVPRLVIPPLGMSTGFSMFAMHAFRVPWTWGISAFVLGAGVFAYPVIATSRLTRQGDLVMMHRSRWFIVILLSLAALRLALRGYVGEFLSAQQTAGLFFILAFGMIVRWRSSLYVQYKRLMAGGPKGADAKAPSTAKRSE
jgi:membrane protein CcdC involved in cytochrome C biogenesis